MSDVAVRFLELIKTEVDQVEELNSLLQAERQMLEERRYDELETMADKKNNISTAIEHSAKQRMELISASSNDKEAVQLFLSKLQAKEAGRIQDAIADLSRVLGQCRELNAINGQIIATNMQTRTSLIDALKGQPGRDATRLYTPTGALGDSAK